MTKVACALAPPVGKGSPELTAIAEAHVAEASLDALSGARGQAALSYGEGMQLTVREDGAGIGEWTDVKVVSDGLVTFETRLVLAGNKQVSVGARNHKLRRLAGGVVAAPRVGEELTLQLTPLNSAPLELSFAEFEQQRRTCSCGCRVVPGLGGQAGLWLAPT